MLRSLNIKWISLWVLVGIIAFTTCASCEKVIDINLNKANPKYVIEGNLSDQPGDCKVLISRTVNFSDSSVFNAVRHAVVTIREDQKEPIKLIETVPGVYRSNMYATSSHLYTLSVKVDGQEFSSTVKVPEKASFDSLYIIDFNSFGNSRKFANVIFKDPDGLGNAYRFLQYKNKKENPNIFVLNDLYSDGRTINTFLAFFSDSDNQRLDRGDTVRVEMQGIDPSVYKFFFSLNQASRGSGDNVAPGNPVGNIEGGAIGYFNAYVKQTRTVIVP